MTETPRALSSRADAGARRGDIAGTADSGTPPARRPAQADRVRMRCPVCEAPAEWAGQKWRCRRCGWLAS